ncbi:CheR family methyltransferase [Burkholderia alba]|uniref:CheR family methyltransferase n=1 Tax=Burkholderia alba TaxID=2683677 RepID=UPI002B05A6C3|nr:CheR family methyltransferase [Burkholderia alba]
MNVFDPRFQAWLSRETGIDPASLGNDFVARALLERIGATQYGDAERPVPTAIRAQQVSEDVVDAYWRLLNTSCDERRALIELFVVPETWFFREREAFTALARGAHERLFANPARVLRVLSAPCSTGEEPYSAAMALLDAGIDPVRFEIDGIDISGRAIAHAERACYGRNSFRGHALEFRDQHFKASAEGWQLDERVRACVRFRQANLLEMLANGQERYDFIFCRNVLIYFEQDAQDRVVRGIDARLAPDGMVFVGPAETGVVMRQGMMSAKIPLAFAFRRSTAADAPPLRFGRFDGGLPDSNGFGAGQKRPAPLFVPPVDVLSTLVAPPSVPVHEWFADISWPLPAPAAAPSVPVAAAPEWPGHGLKPVRSLDAARELADAGAFDAAQQAVEVFAESEGPTADAFYLLGLIADARGRATEAGDFYRKALYLEPTHHEALTHLATLLDVAGDRAGAQWLMQRARRAAQYDQASLPTGAGTSRGTHGPRRR